MSALRFPVPIIKKDRLKAVTTIVNWLNSLLRPGLEVYHYDKISDGDVIRIYENSAYVISIQFFFKQIRVMSPNGTFRAFVWELKGEKNDENGHFSSCEDVQETIEKILLEKGYMSALGIIVKSVEA